MPRMMHDRGKAVRVERLECIILRGSDGDQGKKGGNREKWDLGGNPPIFLPKIVSCKYFEHRGTSRKRNKVKILKTWVAAPKDSA